MHNKCGPEGRFELWVDVAAELCIFELRRLICEERLRALRRAEVLLEEQIRLLVCACLL
jgi:hypothetical protein